MGQLRLSLKLTNFTQLLELAFATPSKFRACCLFTNQAINVCLLDAPSLME